MKARKLLGFILFVVISIVSTSTLNTEHPELRVLADRYPSPTNTLSLETNPLGTSRCAYNPLRFGPGVVLGDELSAYDSGLGDLDRDGDEDVITPDFDDLIAWQNSGRPFEGRWWANSLGSSSSNRKLYAVMTADVDNDGYADALASNLSGYGASPQLFVWRNDGSPFFGTWPRTVIGSCSGNSVIQLVAGDLDNDGDTDVVSGEWTGYDAPGLAVWQNDGTPFDGSWACGFVDAGYPAAVQEVTALEAGDIDRDGDLDIVSNYRTSTDWVIAWQNDGSPFSGLWPSQGLGAMGAQDLALGDVDQDGWLDAVVVGLSEVAVFRNNGTPFNNLWQKHAIGNAPASTWLRVVDMNDLDLDGDLDVVASGDGLWTEQVPIVAWLNDGTPFDSTWSSRVIGYGLDDVTSIHAVDLDSDGDLDLLATDKGGWELVAWRNLVCEWFVNLPVVLKNY